MNQTTVYDFHESDALRLQLQQFAHQRRAQVIEQCLEDELALRMGEWSTTVNKYMEAVRRLDQLYTLSVRAVRNENLISCLKGAQIEIDRVRTRFGQIINTLESMNGININSESIERVSARGQWWELYLFYL